MFLACGHWGFQQLLWNRLSLHHCYVLAPFSEICWSLCMPISRLVPLLHWFYLFFQVYCCVAPLFLFRWFWNSDVNSFDAYCAVIVLVQWKEISFYVVSCPVAWLQWLVSSRRYFCWNFPHRQWDKQSKAFFCFLCWSTYILFPFLYSFVPSWLGPPLWCWVGVVMWAP